MSLWDYFCVNRFMISVIVDDFWIEFQQGYFFCDKFLYSVKSEHCNEGRWLQKSHQNRICNQKSNFFKIRVNPVLSMDKKVSENS